MSVRAASYALAGYWAALMLTRAWLGRGRSSLTGGRLVLASAAASALVAALLVTASRPPLAVAMVVALGAALAGIFPAVLGVAASRFPAHSGTVFGLLFTMALTGGMTLPWVTGQAAAAWGLRPALGPRGPAVSGRLRPSVVRALAGRGPVCPSELIQHS